MVVLAVTWMAKVGHEAEVTTLFEKLTEQSRKEPGCAMYQVHRHKTEPRRYFIYEQYKDDAALEAHRAAPHFLQHAKKELPRIADRVEGHLFEPLGSVCVAPDAFVRGCVRKRAMRMLPRSYFEAVLSIINSPPEA
jgi:quinol monooxygenase YgiN